MYIDLIPDILRMHTVIRIGLCSQGRHTHRRKINSRKSTTLGFEGWMSRKELI